MLKMIVEIPGNSYPIIFERGLGSRLGNEIKKVFRGQNIALVTDENVARIYSREIRESLEGQGFTVDIIAVPPGEKSKSLSVLEFLYNRLLDAGIRRDSLIIAFGGGVVGDLGGFAAATLMRGIPLVQVPTTLLAQIDSSIGGKVAVDLPRGKNLVGAFYQPKAVYIDFNFLNTLEKRFLRDGMGEVIKYAAIKDRKLFDYLLDCAGEDDIDFEKVIPHCCFIKKEIVAVDEQDRGERMLLNFGHTLGHALEKYSCYEKFTHGEAVAVGMHVFTENSELMGWTKKGTAALLKNVLDKFYLPSKLPSVDIGQIVKIIKEDKKSFGTGINVVLLKEPGEAYIKNIALHNFDMLYRLLPK
ncbi:MAG: 3-dehydroquinate synthase [Bacillota bacterium]|jgi:3-dehydroquinate synthase|nr:3-dehydroquinate synthase [Clostridia bacterium]